MKFEVFIEFFKYYYTAYVLLLPLLCQKSTYEKLKINFNEIRIFA